MITIHSDPGQDVKSVGHCTPPQNNFSEIELNNGMIAIVDKEYFPLVSEYSWYAYRVGSAWYSLGHERVTRGKWKTIQMQRLILNPKKPFVIDHINGNGLDNRRSNLRIATQSQNLANRAKKKNCSSEYKGVHWDKRTSRWLASITKNSKKTYLGIFKSEIDAANAYDISAAELFGEFARLNFPHGNTSENNHTSIIRPVDTSAQFGSGRNSARAESPSRIVVNA